MAQQDKLIHLAKSNRFPNRFLVGGDDELDRSDSIIIVDSRDDDELDNSRCDRVERTMKKYMCVTNSSSSERNFQMLLFLMLALLMIMLVMLVIVAVMTDSNDS